MRNHTLRSIVDSYTGKTRVGVPRTKVRNPSKWVARFLLPLVILCLSPTANATTVIITGTMEGNLPIHTGDTMKAGYDFTMPGNHPAAVVTFSNVVVTITTDCGTHSFTVNFPPVQSYPVAQNYNGWVPSGDQNSSLVYQGHGTVPCTGHATRATFTANVTSTDNCDPLHIRFHYSDHSAGSWSSTISIKPTCTSAPCTCH